MAPNRERIVSLVIGPDRSELVDKTDATALENLLTYYSPLTSSSYAVFDSGWKYVYDRFNNTFVYVPCNPDVAGTMVRTEIESFPWFSPAGLREVELTIFIKLAYNPSKAQIETNSMDKELTQSSIREERVSFCSVIRQVCLTTPRLIDST